MAAGYDYSENSRPDSQFIKEFAEVPQIQPFKQGRAPFDKTNIDIQKEMPAYQEQDRRKSP